MFEDVKRWFRSRGSTKKQAANYVTDIKLPWKCIDAQLTLHPNSLVEPNDIEDLYFKPRLDLIANDNLAPEDQKKGDSVFTIQKRLTEMDLLLQFSKCRSCYIGLNALQIAR